MAKDYDMKNDKQKPVNSIYSQMGTQNSTKLKVLMVLLSFIFICFWGRDASAAATWYKYGPVIHACGAYHGYTYTNSKEALLHTLKVRKSRRKLPIEVDFILTSDGVPVCIHDWSHYNHSNGINSNKRMSLKQFKRSHTKGKLTPMTAEEAIDIMAKTKNAYLVIDTKETGVKIYRELVKVCRKRGHSSFLNRMIIQLYYYKDYKRIKRVYPFKHWLFSTYKIDCWSPAKIKKIVKKVQKMKLDALVMPYNVFAKKINTHYKMKDHNLRAVNTNRHIPLIIHTVNSRRLYYALRRNRVNGMYTDDIKKW